MWNIISLMARRPGVACHGPVAGIFSDVQVEFWGVLGRRNRGVCRYFRCRRRKRCDLDLGKLGNDVQVAAHN
jgi:hypothetical protein